MPKRLENVGLVELNEAYNKVLSWFFSFPETEAGLNDLAEYLKISKTTAKKIVERMVEEEFLIKKVYGKAWRIACNRSHPYNYTKKIAFNLSMVFEAYNKSLKNQIQEIVGIANAIVLFGSYRKGDDTEKSDVDIAVEVNSDKDVRIIEMGRMPRFGYRKDVPVNLHIFTRNKIDINLFSNIANGIVLEGFLEVRP
ncbi:MAG: nucleotidyltransferase domain-containing protein [DPANN group archaeon]|nr:nucleotidyltransferase domain-containing protein [DPANN group archaeon]